MKKNRKSKTTLIIFALFIQSILIGAGIFGIGLRNVDTDKNRLVNIDALIGGSYMPDPSKTPNPEDSESEQVEQEAEEQQTEEPTSNVKAEVKPPKSTSITVRVSGTKIFINSRIIVGAPFKDQFEDVYDGTQTIILQDDYADYLTYMEILKILEEKGIKPDERKL